MNTFLKRRDLLFFLWAVQAGQGRHQWLIKWSLNPARRAGMLSHAHACLLNYKEDDMTGLTWSFKHVTSRHVSAVPSLGPGATSRPGAFWDCVSLRPDSVSRTQSLGSQRILDPATLDPSGRCLCIKERESDHHHRVLTATIIEHQCCLCPFSNSVNNLCVL